VWIQEHVPVHKHPFQSGKRDMSAQYTDFFDPRMLTTDLALVVNAGEPVATSKLVASLDRALETLRIPPLSSAQLEDLNQWRRYWGSLRGDKAEREKTAAAEYLDWRRRNQLPSGPKPKILIVSRAAFLPSLWDALHQVYPDRVCLPWNAGFVIEPDGMAAVDLLSTALLKGWGPDRVEKLLGGLPEIYGSNLAKPARSTRMVDFANWDLFHSRLPYPGPPASTSQDAGLSTLLSLIPWVV
jgi:hypothetical protein